MTAERYQKIYRWFQAHPLARHVVLAADALIPVLLGLLYGIMLGRYGLAWYKAASFSPTQDAAAQAGVSFWHVVLIPAATLAVGSLLRRWLNRPRPYTQPGFMPLKEKEGDGCSLPSRHSLSAGVIASVWLCAMPWGHAGLLVLLAAVCTLRVLVGVHYIRDVLAGAALGFACGLLVLL